MAMEKRHVSEEVGQVPAKKRQLPGRVRQMAEEKRQLPNLRGELGALRRAAKKNTLPLGRRVFDGGEGNRTGPWCPLFFLSCPVNIYRKRK